MISEKPNAITPTNPFKEAPLLAAHDDVIGKDRNARVGKAQFLDDLRRTIRSTGTVPTKKYAHPMTTNQEIGWFADSRPMTSSTARWHHPLNSTAITQFAADYEKLRGINPFKIKERMKAERKKE